MFIISRNRHCVPSFCHKHGGVRLVFSNIPSTVSRVFYRFTTKAFPTRYGSLEVSHDGAVLLFPTPNVHVGLVVERVGLLACNISTENLVTKAGARHTWSVFNV